MTEHERTEDVRDRQRTDGGPDSVVAPFPPERPVDDQRPDSQKEGEARATRAALAGEHGTEGPPQYLDAPKPHGHHAGDYEIPGERAGAKVAADRQSAADQRTADKDKADQDKADQKAANKADQAEAKADKPKEDDSWRDRGSAASR